MENVSTPEMRNVPRCWCAPLCGASVRPSSRRAVLSRCAEQDGNGWGDHATPRRPFQPRTGRRPSLRTGRARLAVLKDEALRPVVAESRRPRSLQPAVRRWLSGGIKASPVASNTAIAGSGAGKPIKICHRQRVDPGPLALARTGDRAGTCHREGRRIRRPSPAQLDRRRFVHRRYRTSPSAASAIRAIEPRYRSWRSGAHRQCSGFREARVDPPGYRE
jgi:hypothetical protein